MQEVAAEAGVSISTVSKVINGRDGIASETVEHVTGVIARLGFEPSLVARSLRNHGHEPHRHSRVAERLARDLDGARHGR